jgi:Flp pilus assembly protein TadD
LGIAYRRQGKLLEAARQYLQVLEIDSELPEAYNNLGVIMWQLGKYSTASSYFQRALDKDPRHTKALENLQHVSEEWAGGAIAR